MTAATITKTRIRYEDSRRRSRSPSWLTVLGRVTGTGSVSAQALRIYTIPAALLAHVLTVGLLAGDETPMPTT
jgi:hypothetical protein